MTWLVEHSSVGYLKLPEGQHNPGDECSQIPLMTTYSVVTDPGDATGFGRDRAEGIAFLMNKKESTKVWAPISWQDAYKAWKK